MPVESGAQFPVKSGACTWIPHPDATMAGTAPDIISELGERGLVAQTAGGDGLSAHLAGGPRTLYCGFDPTAESLHVGSLVPLLALRRFQLAGHRPIVLVGGATGMIGDPSFKASERPLDSAEAIRRRADVLRPQLGRFLDFDRGERSAMLVDNLEWTGRLDVLSFLRDVGKHFSVNAMIRKEAVRQRIEREDGGISFTEFSYLLLQSYDFAELHRRHGCTLQIGGSDQWGNITGGIDLTRRLHRARVYGLTLPLVTRADGQKFGKTEAGAVWISPAMTSPYAFYQFWMNAADADAYAWLGYFTMLPPARIEEIRRADAGRGGRPEAQEILAREVTELVHGREGLEAAVRISRALFSGETARLTEDDLRQLELDGLPCSAAGGGTLAEALVSSGLARSGRMAREFIGGRAVSVNGRVVEEADFALSPERAMHGRYFILRRGKKRFHLLRTG